MGRLLLHRLRLGLGSSWSLRFWVHTRIPFLFGGGFRLHAAWWCGLSMRHTPLRMGFKSTCFHILPQLLDLDRLVTTS
jgi:hypothetical protein